MTEGLLDQLQDMLRMWGEKMSEVWQLLTTSPQAFKGGEIWGVIININTAMQGIAYGLLILFFAAGVLHQTINFQELRRPEAVLKLFLRFAIAKGIVTYCMEILLAVMEVSQGILQRVVYAAGGSHADSTMSLPGQIIEAVNDVGFFEGIPLWAVTLIGGLIATALAFVVILTVYGRFFKIYMLTALAPIPLSSFAGEHVSQTARHFLRNYFAACLEFVIVALAIIISSKLISAPPAYVADGRAAIVQVWDYLVEVIFNMLLVVGTVKMCDHIAQQLLGQ